MLTIVQLTGVNGEPIVKLELPRAFLGDPIRLKFQLRRQSNGRTDVLTVNAPFKVTAVGLDTSLIPHRQILSVEPATSNVPVWKSVKRVQEALRVLPPARFPKTLI